MDGDILVHAGDDFRPVVAVIDDGFMQAAVARSAIDRQVFDAEGVEHVDHEIAAARGLIDRIGGRRQGLRGDLPWTRNGSLARLRGGGDGVGGRRRNHCGRGAGKSCAFEEIATAGIGGTALRHDSSLKWQYRRKKNRRVFSLDLLPASRWSRQAHRPHGRYPGEQCSGVAPYAAACLPHNVRVAIRAPSTKDFSFAHMIVGWTRRANGLCAKPQSVPPITFSRPTIFASRTMRSATSSGCSTMLVAWLITPGIKTLPGFSFTLCHTRHSCACRGLAASNE